MIDYEAEDRAFAIWQSIVLITKLAAFIGIVAGAYYIVRLAFGCGGTQ